MPSLVQGWYKLPACVSVRTGSPFLTGRIRWCKTIHHHHRGRARPGQGGHWQAVVCHSNWPIDWSCRHAASTLGSGSGLDCQLTHLASTPPQSSLSPSQLLPPPPHSPLTTHLLHGGQLRPLPRRATLLTASASESTLGGVAARRWLEGVLFCGGIESFLRDSAPTDCSGVDVWMGLINFRIEWWSTIDCGLFLSSCGKEEEECSWPSTPLSTQVQRDPTAPPWPLAPGPLATNDSVPHPL
jgi:hypothetical protein